MCARQKRKADRKTGGDAGPPQRDDRARDFLFAVAPHDLVDHRRTGAGKLLDILEFALGNFLLRFGLGFSVAAHAFHETSFRA
jgi:hypothetical protein